MPRWLERVRASAPRLAAVLAVAAVPIVLDPTQLAAVATTIALAIALLSLNVLLGYGGQISLGQAAFVGSGAFLAFQLGGRGLPLPVAVLGAGLGVAAITAIVGLPSLRIRGLAVGIATLVYGIAAEKYLFNQPWFTGSSAGLQLPALFEHRQLYPMFLVSLAFLLATVALDRQLLATKLGRAFITVRDGEDRAVAFGVEPGRTKLQAYALSGFLAGVAGGLIAYLSGLVSGADFGFVASLELLAFAVLGGIGSRTGVLIAAGLLIGVPQLFPPPDERIAPLLGGVLLVLVILFLPAGFGGLAARLRRRAASLPRAVRIGAVTAATVAVGAGVVRLYDLRVGAGELAGPLPLALALASLAAVAVAYAIAAPPARGRAATAAAPTDEAAVAAQAARAAANATIVRRVPRDLSLRMPTRVMFEARSVGVRFGGVQALDDIDLEVREGEIVGLIGANGAGKSTFYNVVSGFVTPTPGSQLSYKGRDLLALPPALRTRLGIARTFQHMGLIRAQTVEDNVLLAQHWLADYDEWAGLARLGGVHRTEQQLRERARLALEIFSLESHLDERLGALPYGTMRMVELASAVAGGSDLLFFDEASAGLSPDEAHALADRFHALRDELDLTLVVIEHHVPLIARVCDHVYCLASGRKLAEGVPASIQSDPEVIAEFLGRSQIERAPA